MVNNINGTVKSRVIFLKRYRYSIYNGTVMEYFLFNGTVRRLTSNIYYIEALKFINSCKEREMIFNNFEGDEELSEV